MGQKAKVVLAIVILLILIMIFVPEMRPWANDNRAEWDDEMFEAFGGGRGGGMRGGMGRGGGMRGWRGRGGMGHGGGWRGHRGGGWAHPRPHRPYYNGGAWYGSWWPWNTGDVNVNYYGYDPISVIESVTQETNDASSGGLIITRLWSDGRWTRSTNGDMQDRGQIPSARAESILKQADQAEDTGGIVYINNGKSYDVVIRYSSGETTRKSVGMSIMPDDIDGGDF